MGTVVVGVVSEERRRDLIERNARLLDILARARAAKPKGMTKAEWKTLEAQLEAIIAVPTRNA